MISKQNQPVFFFSVWHQGTIIDKKRHGTIRRHRLSQGHEEKHLEGAKARASKNCQPYLVGGFSPTHLEKYARQIGSFPKF